MSRHRALRAKVKRGIAKWPVLIVVLVVLLGLSWLALSWAGGVLDKRSQALAQNCSEGDSVLRISVTPSVAEAVRDVAHAYSATRPVVYDHCIAIEVISADSSAVLEGLTTAWDEQKLGKRPHAWLPDSTLWANRLSALNAKLVGSAPKSVGTSPVLLAAPEAAAPVLKDFRWSDMPEVTDWSKYGQSWGRFSVAMPDPATNTASALAIQAALAGGKGPVTAESLGSDAAKASLSKLAATVPPEVPPTTRDALRRLGDSATVNAAGFSATPVSEVDLFKHNTGKEAPSKPLVGVLPAGPAPVADFPYVALGGSEVGEAEVRAAQAFRDFMTEPSQQAILARGGLRVESTQDRPSPSPGVSWSPVTENLVAADATTTQQLSSAWASADRGGQVVTVLTDVSTSMKPRLDKVKAALRGQVDRSVSGSFGLWEFARDLDGSKPHKQLVATGPVSEKRDALRRSIDALKTADGSQLYTALAACYETAHDGFVAGRVNRVVVITDSTSDGGIDLAALKAQLHGTDLPVSFIAIGGEVDKATLTDIAQTTGGSVSVVENVDGVEAALGQVLSTNA
ncbi:substrate-binding and VWA domain-containing protein [Lentzea californiensis]|uniref:substrate-binding and VWA domain-containing protein n=1 Tax=Lentzea californiensis TaxID=438851 RepID=UPI0021661B8C|nr:substrate-binding and VWA domain-containing protein [Lentzea californiensis]MCR3753264.1 von Willebrand factor type A domain-containing protein [Lentzea californiensis]